MSSRHRIVLGLLACSTMIFVRESVAQRNFSRSQQSGLYAWNQLQQNRERMQQQQQRRVLNRNFTQLNQQLSQNQQRINQMNRMLTSPYAVDPTTGLPPAADPTAAPGADPSVYFGRRGGGPGGASPGLVGPQMFGQMHFNTGVYYRTSPFYDYQWTATRYRQSTGL